MIPTRLNWSAFSGPLVAALFALAFATPSGAAVTDEGCVDVFEHVAFQGESLRFCGDSVEHWLPSVDWHDRVSSFRCGKGIELVRFRNSNVPGVEMSIPCSEGANGLPNRGFDDSSTHLQIFDIPPGCVLLFEDSAARGASWEICGDGNHWLPYEPGGINWHYRVSSLVCGEHVDQLVLINGNVPGQQFALSCAQGWTLPYFDNLSTNVSVESVDADCVRLYDNPDLSGALYTVCGEGDHWLPYNPGVVDWHYRVSSFRCGPGVGRVRFVNGNVPGEELDLSCARADELASRFDNLSTNVDLEYAFTCSPWDGSVPATGTLLRFRDSVVYNDYFSRYRTDLASQYLTNADHGGVIWPKFTSTDPDSRTTLYEVVESRSTSWGVEVRVESPAEGLAPGVAIGFSYSTGSLTTAAAEPVSTDRQWLGLAARYAHGGLPDKTAPRAFLQRVDVVNDIFYCTQQWVDKYQNVACTDPWISSYAPANLAGEVIVEVCQTR